MKTKINLLISFLVIFISINHNAFSQWIGDPEDDIWHYCGADKANKGLMTNSLYNSHVQQVEDEIRSKIIERENAESQNIIITEDPIVIPVVFHIVHIEGESPGGSTNLSDERIYTALNHLNQAFANEIFSMEGENTKISFCLADKDSNGAPSLGITRYPSNNFTDYNQSNHESPIPGPIGPNSMKAIVAPPEQWSRFDYLNIWTVTNIPGLTAGHAYLSGSHGQWWDGVVLEAQYLGSSLENNRLLIHEVGHYLNLKHTFEPGPSDDPCVNNNPLIDNDCIPDTPPDEEGNACDPTFPSCGTAGSADRNYMDYGNLVCEEIFTEDQKIRMRSSILNDLDGTLGPRGSLLSSSGCCDNLTVNAFFTYTSSGYEVSFNASGSTGNIDTYVWDFGNNQTITLNNNNTSHVFIEPGIYLVSLTVIPQNNTGCINTYSVEVEVCNYDFETNFSFDISNDNNVLFNASDIGDDVSNFTWHFGDGDSDSNGFES